MIILSHFDAFVWAVVISSFTTIVVTPLAIRYGTPDTKKEN